MQGQVARSQDRRPDQKSLPGQSQVQSQVQRAAAQAGSKRVFTTPKALSLESPQLVCPGTMMVNRTAIVNRTAPLRSETATVFRTRRYLGPDNNGGGR